MARRPAVLPARGREPGRSDIPVAAVPRVVPHTAPSAALLVLLLGCTPSPPADPTTARAEPPEEGDVEPESTAQAAAPAGSQRPLVWLSSEREALERGREERRPVLVHFDSQWCADCKRMKQETFGDPRVEARAGRFVAVRIDATNDEDPQVGAALEKYTIINVPTLILLDSSGHEQRRITELVGPEALLQEIEQVR
jgi:thiol:disulfide interchange protein DsbD